MARAPLQSWGSRPSLLGTDVVITETNRVTSGQCSGRSSGGGFTPLGFCVQCGIAHFEQSDFWSQTNWTSALQAQAIALAKAGEDQAREAIQQISGQGVNWHGKLQSTSSSSLAAAFQGAAQQVFEIACSSYYISALFSNYTLPFQYSICFKYLENANFFIYSCLKKLWLCCLPWVVQ